jgi:hypothetical protein
LAFPIFSIFPFATQPPQKFFLLVLKKLLLGKPEGKRPLGRPRRRWVGYIKMDHGEIEWDGRDWIELAQDRDKWRALVNTVMKLLLP